MIECGHRILGSQSGTAAVGDDFRLHLAIMARHRIRVLRSPHASRVAITAQEVWTDRAGPNDDTPAAAIPDYVREVVEELAFQARADQKIDKRSGISQRLPISCLENVMSNAERRALTNGETTVVPRVTDIFASLPSITGKFELEYEGELRGADNVARDLIRAALAAVFTGRFDGVDLQRVIEWFELGGTLQISDVTAAEEVVQQSSDVQGLRELAGTPA